MQVACRGADVAVAQEAADGVQVYAALQQVRGKAVTQGVGAAHLHDAGVVARALIGTLQALHDQRCCAMGVGKQPLARVALGGVDAAVVAQQL